MSSFLLQIMQESKELSEIELKDLEEGNAAKDQAKPTEERPQLYTPWLEELKRVGLEDDEHTQR